MFPRYGSLGSQLRAGVFQPNSRSPFIYPANQHQPPDYVGSNFSNFNRYHAGFGVPRQNGSDGTRAGDFGSSLPESVNPYGEMNAVNHSDNEWNQNAPNVEESASNAAAANETPYNDVEMEERYESETEEFTSRDDFTIETPLTLYTAPQPWTGESVIEGIFSQPKDRKNPSQSYSPQLFGGSSANQFSQSSNPLFQPSNRDAPFSSPYSYGPSAQHGLSASQTQPMARSLGTPWFSSGGSGGSGIYQGLFSQNSSSMEGSYSQGVQDHQYQDAIQSAPVAGLFAPPPSYSSVQGSLLFGNYQQSSRATDPRIEAQSFTSVHQTGLGGDSPDSNAMSISDIESSPDKTTLIQDKMGYPEASQNSPDSDVMHPEQLDSPPKDTSDQGQMGFDTGASDTLLLADGSSISSHMTANPFNVTLVPQEGLNERIGQPLETIIEAMHESEADTEKNDNLPEKQNDNLTFESAELTPPIQDVRNEEQTEVQTEEKTKEQTEVQAEEITEEQTEVQAEEITEEQTEVQAEEITEEQTEVQAEEITEEQTEVQAEEITEEQTEVQTEEITKEQIEAQVEERIEEQIEAQVEERIEEQIEVQAEERTEEQTEEITPEEAPAHEKGTTEGNKSETIQGENSIVTEPVSEALVTVPSQDQTTVPDTEAPKEKEAEESVVLQNAKIMKKWSKKLKRRLKRNRKAAELEVQEKMLEEETQQAKKLALRLTRSSNDKEFLEYERDFRQQELKYKELGKAYTYRSVDGLSEEQVDKFLPIVESDDYYYKPNPCILRDMVCATGVDGLKRTPGFVIARKGYGKVEFEWPVDITKMEINKIVEICRGHLDFINGLGQFEGIPMTVTLHKVFDEKAIDVYEETREKLEDCCMDKGYEMVSYDVDGTWVFRVYGTES
eukprot:g5950.t1